MSGDTELKLCPSCKSEQVEMMCGEGLRYGYCNSCEMQGPKYQDERKANTAWDNLSRVTPPGLETVPEGTMEALLQAANKALQALDFLSLNRGYMGEAGTRKNLNDALQPFAERIAKMVPEKVDNV
jgi:hypothetical protein